MDQLTVKCESYFDLMEKKSEILKLIIKLKIVLDKIGMT